MIGGLIAVSRFYRNVSASLSNTPPTHTHTHMRAGTSPIANLPMSSYSRPGLYGCPDELPEALPFFRLSKDVKDPGAVWSSRGKGPCSGHGKGEWDGVGGSCKNHAAMYVIEHEDFVMPSAWDLFNLLNETYQAPLKPPKKPGAANAPLAPLKQRVFHYVPVEAVDHARKSQAKERVEGTLSIHQIGFPGESDLKIYHRRLSCFCDPCKQRMRSYLSTLTVGPCVNALHVPALKEATLVVEDATTRRTLQGYFGEEYEAPASAECVMAATGRKGPSQRRSRQLLHH